MVVCVYGCVCLWGGGGECVGMGDYGEGMSVYVGGGHAWLNGFLLLMCMCAYVHMVEGHS